MPKKWTYGTIGTVSEATMRPEDLIPAFCSELRYLGHRDKELSRIEKDSQREGYYDTEDAGYDLEFLFDVLDEHALPYMYFGAHPGNGSDYGFWVSEGIEYDFDGLKVDDLSEIPTGYTGEVLHVNDHGNMTLYACKRGKLREVWAVI
jgi:hypothetical protein